MNDGQYTNLRNYLEEIASTSKQVLTEQKRTNELLATGPLIVYTNGDVDFEQIAQAVNERLKGNTLPVSVETEPPPDAHLAAVTQKVDTSKGKTAAKKGK